MADRTYAVHVPALSLPEAAMLPARPRERSVPGNLVLRDRRTYYPMPSPARERPLQPTPTERAQGSMAGRAVLAAVQWPSPKKKGRA